MSRHRGISFGPAKATILPPVLTSAADVQYSKLAPVMFGEVKFTWKLPDLAKRKAPQGTSTSQVGRLETVLRPRAPSNASASNLQSTHVAIAGSSTTPRCSANVQANYAVCAVHPDARLQFMEHRSALSLCSADWQDAYLCLNDRIAKEMQHLYNELPGGSLKVIEGKTVFYKAPHGDRVFLVCHHDNRRLKSSTLPKVYHPDACTDHDPESFKLLVNQALQLHRMGKSSTAIKYPYCVIESLVKDAIKRVAYHRADGSTMKFVTD